MADISRLSRLVAGIQRHVDLSASGNALHVDSLKVGNTTPAELTKAILTNLIALQNGTDFSDGTNSHTHDGRYRTETELASTSNGEGASLIGIEDASAYYAGAEVEAALNELEGQIGGLTSSTFTFAEANVLANNDALYAALDKLDLKWGDLASIANGEGASLVGLEDSAGLYAAANVEAALAEVGQDAADLRTLSGTADGATNLGTFTGSTITDNSTIKTAIQELETAHEANANILAGWEWQNSVLDYVVDNTAVPATEVSGDRYMLSDDGGAPNAAWDGASAGDLVEFNGTIWVATTPTTGMVANVDDEASSLRQWSGSAWVQKFFESTTASTGLTKVGFDIRLADAAENASGIQVSGGAITLNDLGAFSTSDLVEGTNEYFTEARVRATVLTGIDVSTNGSVVAGSSVLAALGFLQANQADLTTLSGAAQGAVDLGTFTGGTISDNTTIKGALQELESAVEGGSSSVTETMTAGETLTAGNRAVRMGITANAETAGRIYFADPTELSATGKDPFHVIGLCVAAGEAAAATIEVTKVGPITMTAHGFAVGEPIWLDSTGALTATAPTTAAEAVVKVGMAKDANTIEVQIQVMGVN